MSSNIARRGRCCRRALVRSQRRVPLLLHRLNLLEKQFEPIQFAIDLGLEVRR